MANCGGRLLLQQPPGQQKGAESDRSASICLKRDDVNGMICVDIIFIKLDSRIVQYMFVLEK